MNYTIKLFGVFTEKKIREKKKKRKDKDTCFMGVLRGNENMRFEQMFKSSKTRKKGNISTEIFSVNPTIQMRT